jgi:hypothetical protein
MSAEFWTALSAIGSLAAAVVAAGAAVTAGAIAKGDRKAAILREQREREHDRQTAARRDRLAQRVEALEAYEAARTIPGNYPEQSVANARLLAALRVLEDCPDFLRRRYVPNPGEVAPTDADREAVRSSLGYDHALDDDTICRALLSRRIDADRHALYGDPA